MIIQPGDEAEKEYGIEADEDGTYICDNCKVLIGHSNDLEDNWGRLYLWQVSIPDGDRFEFCSKLCMIVKLKLTKEEAIAEEL